MRSAIILLGIWVAMAGSLDAAGREIKIDGQRRVSLNEGWRFLKGDAEGAQRPEFDDSSWRMVDLPHDWAIEGPFDPKYNPHSGGLPFFGTGWYRKTFTLPESARRKQIAVEFDGAMSNSTVWINGHDLGGRPYGYIGFSFDLTPHLRFGAGQTNVLAVCLAPEDRSSRWYPGAGIYRHVWLDVTAASRVARWGTYITTPEVSDRQAVVVIQTEIENRGSQSRAIALQTAIIDAAGNQVGVASAIQSVPGGRSQLVEHKITVPKPQRWDIEHPYLYTAVSTVRVGAQVLDRYATKFGVRTIAFEKDKGFFLNGRHLKIHGVCNHHDLGALGAAVNARATERQLEIMKAMGVNAIRTSHNPPSPELLDAADRLGVMVMDEAFDMWRRPKVPNGHGKYFDQWGDTDIRDMVRRDRNHPSVILWSIGNEVSEQNDPEGWKIAKALSDAVHEVDRTRPTTSGFNYVEGAIKNRLADQVDVVGFNYRPWQYAQFHKEHPSWIIFGSETASCVSSRGIYHLPIEKYEKHPSLQLSSYDIIAPRYAYCPDVEFQAQDDNPEVLGEFVWTGFDYLGEPMPFFDYNRPPSESRNDWPSRSSYFGVVDLAGLPKDRFYLYQSQWTSKPMVHILPHWNWSTGQTIPVVAYSNAQEVDLLLNGRSLGRKKYGVDTVTLPVGQRVTESRQFVSRYRLEWMVPYEPGTLKAVAYKDGKQVATTEVRTAGPAARVRLTPDRATVSGGGDFSFIAVRIEDKDGNPVPDAVNLV